MKGQLLRVLHPARLGRVFNSAGLFRATTGPDGPVVSVASSSPIPWPGGLTAAVKIGAELIGDSTPVIDRPALALFDEQWRSIGGEVAVEFSASDDWYDSWSLSLKQVIVPSGWQCAVCREPVTDAVHSISHRSRLAIAPWTPTNVFPLQFQPVTVCSAVCRTWAAQHCQEAEQCQHQKLQSLRGLRLPSLRRTPRCSASPI